MMSKDLLQQQRFQQRQIPPNIQASRMHLASQQNQYKMKQSKEREEDFIASDYNTRVNQKQKPASTLKPKMGMDQRDTHLSFKYQSRKQGEGHSSDEPEPEQDFEQLTKKGRMGLPLAAGIQVKRVSSNNQSEGALFPDDRSVINDVEEDDRIRTSEEGSENAVLQAQSTDRSHKITNSELRMITQSENVSHRIMEQSQRSVRGTRHHPTGSSTHICDYPKSSQTSSNHNQKNSTRMRVDPSDSEANGSILDYITDKQGRLNDAHLLNRENNQNQVRILDSSYNNLASKSDIQSSMIQSDLNHYSYHAADYALPDPQRSVGMLAQKSRCDQAQDIPILEANRLNLPMKQGMQLSDQQSLRFYQKRELNSDLLEKPLKKQLPIFVKDQTFRGSRTRNQHTTILGNTASIQHTKKGDDIGKSAQTFCLTSDEDGVFTNHKSPMNQLGRQLFQRHGEDLPATTQTLQTVNRQEHNTNQHQLQQHDTNSKYMLLSNESISQNNHDDNSSNNDCYLRQFIDQPNFIDMNLQTIQKRIQEVLKSKEQPKLAGRKQSQKHSSTNHRVTGQSTQGSSGVKHKYRADEVLLMTDKLFAQTINKKDKRKRSKLKGSTGKKYSQEEKQRLIQYLMKDAPNQPAERQQRKFTDFGDNESCEVPSFSHGHLANEQIVNILAGRNEIEVHQTEESLYKPISKSVNKKETCDQEVKCSSDEEGNKAVSFGRQTYLHSRNTSNPSQHNKSKDFKAEYLKLSEQLIYQAKNQNGSSLTPKNMHSLFLVSDNDLRSYHERILSQVRRVSTSGKSDVFQSLYDMRNRSSERVGQIRLLVEQEKEDQYKRDCTFQPFLESSAQRSFTPLSPQVLGSMQIQEFSLTRSPKQFYEDQMDFKESVQEKITKLKEQLIEQELLKIRNFKLQMSERRRKSLQQRLVEKQQKESQLLNSDLPPAEGKMEESQVNPFQVLKRKVDYDRIEKLYNDGQKQEQSQQQLKEVYQRQRQQSFEIANRRFSQSPKCADYNSSRLIKELRATYNHLSLTPEADIINYLQFLMILQTMNYINKKRATDEENQLLVEAWNSLKTRQYSGVKEDNSSTREGISFKNLVSFLHALHYIHQHDYNKTENIVVESNLYESRPFGHISNIGTFFVKTDQEAFKIHVKYRLFVHNKKYLESLIHTAKKYSIAQEEYKRYTYKPALNERSRSLAENQFQKLSKSLMNKSSVDIKGWELLIKKGELYKDYVVQARVQKEANAISNCTFKPKLNDQTNSKRNTQSIVGSYIQQKATFQKQNDSQKVINHKVRASQLKLQKTSMNMQNIDLLPIQLDFEGGSQAAVQNASTKGIHPSLDIHIESPRQNRKHKFRQSTTQKILGVISTDEKSRELRSPKRYQHSFQVNPVPGTGGNFMPQTTQSPLNETADFQE